MRKTQQTKYFTWDLSPKNYPGLVLPGKNWSEEECEEHVTKNNIFGKLRNKIKSLYLFNRENFNLDKYNIEIYGSIRGSVLEDYIINLEIIVTNKYSEILVFKSNMKINHMDI